jgi:alkanesulfonate monooxygenase SsuD/methylene tetrahydromethanopterin reductase-like flavin-dependent oxidoreductase (luciferase family)
MIGAAVALKFWAMYPFFYPDLGRSYDELVDEALLVAEAAENLGFEGLAFPEHHFFNYMCNPSALNMATLVAARTKRVKLITAVLVLPYYNPLALAETIAQVDHISKGRLQLGMARGANKFEFDRLGIDWQNSRSMYQESLDLMIRAWTEKNVEHHGEFWSSPQATAIPRPYQKPYPKLWVSAQSETGVRDAGRRGMNMLTSPNLGSFAPHGDIDRVMQWYNESSADGSQKRGEVMLLRRVFIDETEERALEQLSNVHQHWNYYMSQFRARSSDDSKRFEERTENEAIVIKDGAVVPADMAIDTSDVYSTYDDPIITGPERAVARFKHYEALGVDHLLTLTAFGGKVSDVIRSMEIMSEQVFPAFR